MTVSVSTVMFREKLSEPMTGGLLAKGLDAGGALLLLLLLLLVVCVLLLVWAALSSLL
jgi:cell division protein FtsL